jgi:hypothetical protein
MLRRLFWMIVTIIATTSLASWARARVSAAGPMPQSTKIRRRVHDSRHSFSDTQHFETKVGIALGGTSLFEHRRRGGTAVDELRDKQSSDATRPVDSIATLHDATGERECSVSNVLSVLVTWRRLTRIGVGHGPGKSTSCTADILMVSLEFLDGKVNRYAKTARASSNARS